MPGIENKPYFPAVEEFLRDLQELDVQALVMVALCGNEDVHDSVGVYRCGPFELASAAGPEQKGRRPAGCLPCR